MKYPRRKADSGANGKGFNQNINNFAGGKNQGFDGFNFRLNRSSRQCRECGSDYLRHAIDEVCQDCLQKAEFLFRENPVAVASAGFG